MIKRPILILELKAKDGTIIEAPALVDSGADKTHINFEYAAVLGVKLGSECNSTGIGEGKVPGYLGTLSFKIKNTDIEMDVPATYIRSSNVQVLLGREVFFDNFKIIFEQSNDTFELIKKK
ncbi:MAG: retroviral-like aspartic protease family protein [Patescibacteria group bacterium]